MHRGLKYSLLALVFASLAQSSHAGPSASSPRLLVHLLDYLGKDYAGAVSPQGQVLSESEFKEQKEFARSALSLSRELPEIKKQKMLVQEIQNLKSLIDHKRAPVQVEALAQKLKIQVISLAQIVEVPPHWPNLVSGKSLFQQNCISCHGVNGAGDGPAGKTLHPVPANFHNPEVANKITPFRAFNTIRVGVPGTAMLPWPNLSDEQSWDLAFYVTSLHFSESGKSGTEVDEGDLALAATQSDEQLMTSLPLSDRSKKKEKIIALRLHGSDGNSLSIARARLNDAEHAYEAKDVSGAKAKALSAYLEGIEPVEPRLRANDAVFCADLEAKMAAVRSSIEGHQTLEQCKATIAVARTAIDQANLRLKFEAPSPWVTFVLTAGILLREGFEAVLILIALLVVVKASGSKAAELWIHGGWIAALGLGFASWFFSGWLMNFSGAQREMLEAVTSIGAVLVLLYIGFWLHSRTEISKWKYFLETQVKTAIDGKKLWGLFGISFMAVFREAFETVLFLRAIALEGGSDTTHAMALGVAISLLAILAISWALLKYSVNIPIRKIFSISSLLMSVLAVILTGKGFHSLQETGALSITAASWNWRSDLLGIYPTFETLLPQVLIAAIVYALWTYGKRPRPVSALT